MFYSMTNIWTFLEGKQNSTLTCSGFVKLEMSAELFHLWKHRFLFSVKGGGNRTDF